MQIHLARDGASLGIFAEDEVRLGLTEGRFRRDDLAWRAGMDGWKPLRDWPEFAQESAFAASVADADALASEIPWERSPGVGSLLRSVWMAFTRPAPLATGRFEAGSVFGGAYLALALALVPLVTLAVLNATQERLQMEALAEFTGRISPGLADAFRNRDGKAEVANPLVLAGCGAFCGAVLVPLLGALLACLVWPGLRLLGAKPAFGRSVTVFILLAGWYLLAVLPVNLGVNLLGLADPLIGLMAGLVGGLFMLVLFCRAAAAALGCALWQVVLAHLFLVLLCCGCCLCLAGLMGAAAAVGS